MSKKKSKHTFSEEEKELIRNMKNDLQMMGVPRDQWSLFIREELRMRQKSKGYHGLKFMNKIKDRFDKVVQKAASKRFGDFGGNVEGIEDFFKQSSQDEIDFMNKMFPDVKFDNIEDLGKHGTTLKKIPRKKKMVVDLDFLDDDD